MTLENLPTSEFQKPKIDKEIEAYIASEDFSPRLSENTVASYSGDFAQFGQFCQNHGITTVGQLTRNDLETWIGEMGSRYSPATIARKVAAAKTLVRWHVCQGNLTEDFEEIFPSNKVPKLEPRTLSGKELDKLASFNLQQKDFRGLRVAAASQIALTIGIKAQEIVKLAIGDIQIDPINDQVELTRKLRTGQTQTLVLNAETGGIVRRYFEERKRYRYCKKSGLKDPLFIDLRGNQLTRQGLWLITKSLGEVIGISNLTPLVLRSTFIRNFGGTVRELHEILGKKYPGKQLRIPARAVN